MALGRNGTDNRQLNRKNFRRPSGRTADFFDLRETDHSSNSDSNPGSPSGRTGDSDSQRPYRERHRVEVNSQDYYNGRSENRTDGYSSRTEDLYGGQQNSGRIVHGNVPGNRSGRTQTTERREISSDLLYGSSMTGGNTAGNSRTGSRNAGTAAARDSSGGIRRSSYSSYERENGGGRSSTYSPYGRGGGSYGTGSENRQNPDRRGSTYSSYGRSGGSYGTGAESRQNAGRRASTYSSYGRRGGSYGTGAESRQNTGRTGGTYSSYGRNDRNSYGRNGSSYGRGSTYSGRRYSDGPYIGEEYPEETYRDRFTEEETEYNDLFDERDYSDEEAVDRRGDLSRRIHQREQSRKEREQQLRALYIRIGAGAVVLLLLIFVLSRVLGAFSSGKEEKEQTQTVAETQADQENTNQENKSEAAADEEATADEEEIVDEEEIPDEEELSDEEKAAQEKDSGTAGQADDSGKTGTDGGGENQAAQEDGQEQGIKGSGYPENGENTDQAAAETDGNKTEAAQTSAITDQPVSPSKAPVQTAAASGLYEKQDDWRFILVNPWYLLPEEYTEVSTSSLPNGAAVDTRCFSDLVKMLDDCRAAGGQPVVCSSYRRHSDQETLYQQEVNKLVAEGMSKEDALIEAGKSVAVPGTSEHEIGLAVDLCDYEYQSLNDAQEDTPTQKWLMEHSWEYGFILRYPENKTDITGIVYEPWHYRYVGKEAAEEITRKGICLEEYLARQQ